MRYMAARGMRHILICLMCVFLIHMYAIAESMPDISISCRPEELLEPAEVILTFTIHNQTGENCANFFLYTADGLVSESLGSIGTGDSTTFTRHHIVTAEELDSEEISYIFSYDDPEDPEHKINTIISTPITHAEPMPECELTRSLSATSVFPGSTVSVVYTVRNTGNTRINNIRISDIPGEFTGRIESLEVGESRSLINRVTPAESTTSEAVLTYDGQEDDPITLAPVEITVSDNTPVPGLKISRDPEDPNIGIGTLILRNPTAQKYFDIVITDDFSSDVITEGLTLAAGASETIIHRFPIRDTMNVRWRIKGTRADGTQLDLMTDTIPVSAVEAEDLDNISISAEAVTPKLKRTGSAVIRLTITNSGDADISDIVINADGNDIEPIRFAVIAPHCSVVRDINLAVSEAGEYAFTCTYLDADGWENTTQSNPVSIMIAPDGVMPTDAKASIIDFAAGSVRIGSSRIFLILLAVGIILLISLTVILIILSRRARIEKQVRIALQKQNKGRS